MLFDKPGLLLVQTDDVADKKIIRAVVAMFRSPAGCLPSEAQHNLVRRQQSFQLRYWRLPVTRRARDLALFGSIRAHGKADTAQLHDPFRNLVDQFALLCLVIVEHQMQFAEGCA